MSHTPHIPGVYPGVSWCNVVYPGGPLKLLFPNVECHSLEYPINKCVVLLILFENSLVIIR